MAMNIWPLTCAFARLARSARWGPGTFATWKSAVRIRSPPPTKKSPGRRVSRVFGGCEIPPKRLLHHICTTRTAGSVVQQGAATDIRRAARHCPTPSSTPLGMRAPGRCGAPSRTVSPSGRLRCCEPPGAGDPQGEPPTLLPGAALEEHLSLASRRTAESAAEDAQPSHLGAQFAGVVPHLNALSR